MQDSYHQQYLLLLIVVPRSLQKHETLSSSGVLEAGKTQGDTLLNPKEQYLLESCRNLNNNPLETRQNWRTQLLWPAHAVPTALHRCPSGQGLSTRAP